MRVHSTRRLRMMATLVAVVPSVILASSQAFAAKNVILMVGDGMGLNHVKAGSYYATGQANKMTFEQYYRCSVKTYAAGGGITDSAAAATAMATGNKVSNGVISQSPVGSAYETILEKAKFLGKRTGLVSSVSIVDATPAAFGAHEASRGNSSGIIGDYLDRSMPNVVFGGGSGSWSSTQITAAQTKGYQYVTNNTQMQGINSTTQGYSLGLFAGGDMAFEYGRPAGSVEPHLSQMASKALSILEQDPDGFFLMIEDGLIDHASNVNQISKEVVELDNTFKMVMTWMQTHPDTMLIVTADHETGSLQVTNNGIGNYPTATTFNSGAHSAANTPFYITGANANLVDKRIVGGAIENTDIFLIMDEALLVPEPGSLLALGGGVLGMVGFAFQSKPSR